MSTVGKKVSAGVILFSKGKLLLCHSTQRKNDKPKQFDNCWTVSKGMVHENEAPIDAAIRELKEETSIDLEDEKLCHLINSNKHALSPVCNFSMRDKQVVLFFVHDISGILQSLPLACSSLIDLESHKLFGEPEMDGYMWVTRDEAHKMVFKSQKFIFENGKLDSLLPDIHF